MIYASYYTGVTSTNMTFKANIGSNNISERFTTPATANQSDYVSYFITKSTNSTENLTVKINNTNSYSSKFKVSNLKIALYSILIPGTTGITGKPRKLKNISNYAGITIFGLHIDNSRITQDAE